MKKADTIKLAAAVGLFLVAGGIIFYTMRDPAPDNATAPPPPTPDQAQQPAQPGQPAKPNDLKVEGDNRNSESFKGPIRVAPGGG
jgi:hypothetical protein